jgi:general secretion pathway protein D
LFKSTSTTKKKRNLMVFIRASIVRDEATMSQLSHRKYNYIRAKQLKRQSDGVTLMPNTRTPVLPNWDDSLSLPPTFEEFLSREENTDDE